MMATVEEGSVLVLWFERDILLLQLRSGRGCEER